MSNQAFHKILCSNCSGRIEFPSEYAGQTIPCPHCQRPVLLRVPPADPAQTEHDYPDPATLTPDDVAKGHKARWNIIYAAAALVGINLIVAAVFLFRPKAGGPLDGIQIIDWKLQSGEYRTFYLTGTVSNSTSRTVEKARVEFETMDESGAPSGKVSAVISNLGPNSLVEFSAQTSATQSVWDAKIVGVFAEKN